MLSFIKRLLGGGKEVAKNERIYNFLDIPFSELNGENSILENIRSVEDGVDGIIIRNVLSSEEIQQIIEDLEAQAEKEVKIDAGLNTYPMAFSQIDQASSKDDEKLAEVFRTIESNWGGIKESFRVPLWQKVIDGLSSISGDVKVEVPKGIGGNGTYNPSTFRRLKPKTGTLVPHCGRYFQKEFPFLFTHMEQDSVLEDQMSFFFTIKESDSDGELVLYDVQWDEAEKRPDHDILEYKDGRKKSFTDPKHFRRQAFKPKAGDLLVFAGGRIWHKVSHVQGKTERITFGGFLTPSKDGKRVFAWS